MQNSSNSRAASNPDLLDYYTALQDVDDFASTYDLLPFDLEEQFSELQNRVGKAYKKVKDILPFDTDDGLILSREGARTRARTRRTGAHAINVNVLLRGSPDTIRDTYLGQRQLVHSTFSPRWANAPRGTLGEDAYGALVQEITLHHVYFYNVNNKPVVITSMDLQGPSTMRILREHAGKHFGKDSPQAVSFAAHMVAEPEANFRRWMKGDDLFCDR